MFVHLLFDGAADGPLGVALDLLGAAQRLAKTPGVGPFPARLLTSRFVSLDGAPIQTGSGRAFQVDGPFDPDRLRRGDVVVIPGLGASSESRLQALLGRQDILRSGALLQRAAAKRARLAASCSATFVLAASGVLDGGEATTTWWLGESFARRFPEVGLRIDRMVVESNGHLTAGAALAHGDLLLALLARVASPALAHLVARYLVLDERISQSRYQVMEHLRADDPTVRQLEAFLRAQPGRLHTLAEMAKATATSPRTLARRMEEALGTTPLRFAQRLRIGRALHLLETTDESVERIAEQVGYADAAAFRRVFKREVGESPRQRQRARSGLRGAEPAV